MQRLRNVLLVSLFILFSLFTSVVYAANLDLDDLESSGDKVVCDWTLNQLLCQDFMLEALSDYSWESNCNSPACTFTISIGQYAGSDIIIIREECSAGLDFGYYWVMYDCDGNLIEECSEGLTGNCDGSAEYYQVDDIEVVYDCESDVLPDNCECVGALMACSASVDVIIENGEGIISSAMVLQGEEEGCNYSFSDNQLEDQLIFSCSDAGTMSAYTVYNLDDGCNACSGNLNIIDNSSCASCPNDVSSILCQLWLVGAINQLNCNSIDPNFSESFKIYTIPNSGSTQILFVQEQFVVSETSSTFTLYDCEGNLLYECNQGLTGTCNDISLDPTLGPIINDTILIYDCEVDFLECGDLYPTFLIENETGGVGEEIDVDVSVSNFNDIVNLQFSIVWDTTVVELIEVNNLNSRVPSFSNSNFCLPNNSCFNKGELSISWFDTGGFTSVDIERFFSMKFLLKGVINDITDLIIPKGQIPVEIVNSNFDVQAYTFRKGSVEIGGTCQTNTHPDYDALMALYNSTDGPNWKESDGWKEGAEGTNCDPCTWFGIGCDNFGRVDSLQLFSNSLSGTIPVEVGQLINLRNLYLSSNNLSGEIPSEIGLLSELVNFSLARNNLTGEIPSELGQLSNLIRMYLEVNNLSGDIPKELGQLSNLLFLQLNENNLSGEIPQELGDLSNIALLYLEENNLTGEIPKELGQLSNSMAINLSENDLSGCFPDELQTLCNGVAFSSLNNAKLPWRGFFTNFCIGDPQIGAPCGIAQDSIIDANCDCIPMNSNCTHPDFDALMALYNSTDGPNWTEKNGWEEGAAGSSCDPCNFEGRTWEGIECDGSGRVTELTLNSNNLSGPIPTEIEGLSNLERLLVINNLLTGDIPSSLSQLINLTVIDLSVNNLTGSLDFLSSLVNLEELNLFSNEFSGAIPNDLQNLTALIELRLSRNNLSGEIPSSLSNLTNLEWLILSDNNITGAIPNSLYSLPNLEWLWLYNNNLTGSIHEDIGNLSNIRTIALYNNNLEGEIPESLSLLTLLSYLNLSDNNLSSCFSQSLMSICGLGQLDGEIFTSPTGATSLTQSYNFLRNNLLPYNGDYERICNGDPQMGAPCGIAQDSIIDMNCDCVSDPSTQRPFITTWKTDNPGFSCSSCITIPTFTGEIYDYDVDWENDGIYDEFSITGNISHDYGSPGSYTVAIRGNFPRVYFNGIPRDSVSQDNYKLVAIDQWGDNEWESMERAFYGCKYLVNEGIDAPNLTSVTNLKSMFGFCESLNSAVDNWDVANIEDMDGLFSYACSFNQDISGWNVSNVNSMRSMFTAAKAFNQDISGWDVSNVEDMRFLFEGADEFNQDIGNWDVNQVTFLGFLFRSAANFNQDISRWDVSNTPDLNGMFDGASSFNQNLGSWEINSATGIASFFRDSGLSCENYSSTLIGWADNSNTPDNLSMSADGLEYGSSAIAARDQLIAKGWTIDRDTEVPNCGSNCTHPDFDALMALYNSTDGLNWDEKFGWEEGAAGTSCDPCNWFGVGCDNLGRVESIGLFNNELSGQIPIEISQLTNLKSLSFGGNNLTGEIPKEIGELSNLSYLLLSNNDLTGAFPLEITNLSELSYLGLHKNNLFGTIPAEIGRLTKLDTFILWDNRFTGVIPIELTTLSNLLFLNLEVNQLSGSIPNELTQLSKLKSLFLGSNNFSGLIPADIDLLSELVSLDFSENNLDGSLPTGLGNLLELENLQLSNNNFIGEIPSTLVNLTKITQLYLDNNNLSGCLPIELLPFCNLQSNTNNNFQDGYNFTGNPLLPYNGDFERICNGEPQIGAPCGIVQDSIIDSNCNCGPILPCPDIEWINLPIDITISCEEVSNIDYELAYSNMGDVNCIEMGTAVADTTLMNDGCDKIITLEWNATHSGVSITAQQNIRITNIPSPVWVNPPSDNSIDCSEISAIDDILEYNNGESGICEIRGTVFANIVSDNDACRDFQILTWTLPSNNCFSEIVHTQTIDIMDCNIFSINDDFLSAMTQENLQFDLLDNDEFPQGQISISIVDGLDDFVIDTMLTQEGVFSFRLEQSFFDTLKIDYEVCDTLCNICERATLFVTDNIFEDIKPTNFLSPNGDGNNDELRFTNESMIDDSELWIFNRSGGEVFYKRDYTNDWSAEGYPAGVYFYVLKVRGAELKNTLTVLK